MELGLLWRWQRREAKQGVTDGLPRPCFVKYCKTRPCVISFLSETDVMSRVAVVMRYLSEASEGKGAGRWSYAFGGNGKLDKMHSPSRRPQTPNAVQCMDGDRRCLGLEAQREGWGRANWVEWRQLHIFVWECRAGGARLTRVVTSLLAGYSRSGMSEIPVDYDPCHRLVRSERFL